MEISGKSSAMLLARRSLCFSPLSIDSKDQEAPEKAGRVPSEGRGREFESRRVRHLRPEFPEFQPLGTTPRSFVELPSLACQSAADSDKCRIAAVAADDRKAYRQPVDRGAGNADLRHSSQPAVTAQAQQAVALLARHRKRLSSPWRGEWRGRQAEDRPRRQQIAHASARLAADQPRPAALALRDHRSEDDIPRNIERE